MSLFFLLDVPYQTTPIDPGLTNPIVLVGTITENGLELSGVMTSTAVQVNSSVDDYLAVESILREQ